MAELELDGLVVAVLADIGRAPPAPPLLLVGGAGLVPPKPPVPSRTIPTPDKSQAVALRKAQPKNKGIRFTDRRYHALDTMRPAIANKRKASDLGLVLGSEVGGNR